jgi:hypothetical protein
LVEERGAIEVADAAPSPVGSSPRLAISRSPFQNGPVGVVYGSVRITNSPAGP